ncbi:porin [Burkholderia sp. S171]|uniref:porin n=1 Tax=Burkholderia sp. S171 TaxID=1641860 RepID=UPI0020B1234B|nr:porin [Burkholderia sp. S171]
MKKLTLLLALMGACPCLALAQGSVTLYGVADEGINFNSNAGGHHQYYLASSVLSGSRFGFRGVEDLGDGFKTVFTLENGYDINSGKASQGGLLFGRQSFVGVTSDRYGSITLGRQYDSSIDYVGPLSASNQWAGYIVANPGDMENFTAANHINNAVKFASLDYGGLKFGGLYALGGISGNFSQNQIYSMGASYGRGPFHMGVAYMNIRNPNASYWATSATNGTAATNNFYSPADSGYASARTQQLAEVAASYSVGNATLLSTYSNTQFKDMNGVAGPLNPAAVRGTATFNSIDGTLKYQFTPSFLLAAKFSHTHGSSVGSAGGATYNQFDFGTLYSLSKRTDLYATAVYQRASGRQSNGAPAVAAINVLTPSSTDHQAAIRFAIRHFF